MAWMADIRGSERSRRDPADGNHLFVFCQLNCEWEARFDLRFRRPAVAVLGARMRRDDVPEEDADAGLCQRPVDNRGRRFCRPDAAELALGRERDARDARASVARRLADEQDRRVRVLVEVAPEALTQQRRAVPFPVEVPCRADAGAGEPVDERAHPDHNSD